MIILCIVLVSCNPVKQNDFIYVISTSSLTESSINTNSYVFDEGDLYGVEKIDSRSVYVFKEYNDGHHEVVEGLWTTEPANIAYFETNEITHSNFLFYDEMGYGKVKVYIPETQEYIDRNIYVYGMADSVTNYPNEEYPQTLDFFNENQEADIRVEGFKIFADQIIALDTAYLSEVTQIPTTGYTNVVEFDLFDDSSSRVYIIKTKEGYFVKFSFSSFICDANNNARIFIIYVIEKDPNATQFSY